MKRKSLYQLDSAIEQIEQAIEDYADENGGLIPDDLDKMLEKLQGEKEQKLECICKWRAVLLAEAISFREEEKRIAKARQLREKIVERLEKNLSEAVPYGAKLEVGTFLLSWRKSTACVIEDENEIPDIDEYKVYLPKIQKANIKRDLKAGLNVPGAKLETRANFSIK